MRFDRRVFAHFEWPLPSLAVVASLIGLITLYSAARSPGVGGLPTLVLRQAGWLVLGLGAMLVGFAVDCRRIERSAYFLYTLAVIAVLLVPFVGTAGGGSRRWLPLGPLTFQPSELMKIALVAALARYFARAPAQPLGLGALLIPALLLVLPAVPILLEPDLGTVGALCLVWLTMVVLGGVRMRSLAAVGLPLLASAPVVWKFLRPYQRQRILAFLSPEADPLGAGYHIIQSKIAVGSGMLWGKGFLHGTQNQLNFLPAQHTDFIFSVFAEEWGFVGAVALLTLYLAIVMRGLVIAHRARDRFGLLLVSGLAAIVFWQVAVNIGMATGMVPVVGIPLPFLSYGGSSLVCLYLAVGLAMSVRRGSFFTA